LDFLRLKVVRLSKEVGEAQARQTARKISLIKGNSGGRFYINEYRALFGPQQAEDGYRYVFIGMLTETDAWFRKWSPSGSPPQTLPVASSGPAGPASPPASPVEPQFQPAEKKLEIADGDTGHSMESLFAAYMRGGCPVLF
jgi:hypothetical protein